MRANRIILLLNGAIWVASLDISCCMKPGEYYSKPRDSYTSPRERTHVSRIFTKHVSILLVILCIRIVHPAVMRDYLVVLMVEVLLCIQAISRNFDPSYHYS